MEFDTEDHLVFNLFSFIHLHLVILSVLLEHTVINLFQYNRLSTTALKMMFSNFEFSTLWKIFSFEVNHSVQNQWNLSKSRIKKLFVIDIYLNSSFFKVKIASNSQWSGCPFLYSWNISKLNDLTHIFKTE